MASISKPVPPVWLKHLSRQVLEELDHKYSRPLAVTYGGPYKAMNKKMTEAFYNDIVLSQIRRGDAQIEHSPRFGFFIRRLYDFKNETYKVLVGFDMQNSILAYNSFIKAIRGNKKEVALDIHHWLHKNISGSWFAFGQGESIYIYDPNHSAARIQRELGKYGGHQEKSLESNGNNNTEGAEFTVERELKKFRGLSEKEIKENLDSLTKASMKIFNELYFLYYHLFTTNSRKD